MCARSHGEEDAQPSEEHKSLGRAGGDVLVDGPLHKWCCTGRVGYFFVDEVGVLSVNFWLAGRVSGGGGIIDEHSAGIDPHCLCLLVDIDILGTPGLTSPYFISCASLQQSLRS